MTTRDELIAEMERIEALGPFVTTVRMSAYTWAHLKFALDHLGVEHVLAPPSVDQVPILIDADVPDWIVRSSYTDGTEDDIDLRAGGTS